MTDKTWKVLSLAVLCGTAVWTGRIDVQAVESEPAFTSGSSIAGIGVAIDQYKRSGSDQAVTAGLTQEKARYLTVNDLFYNMGVARVTGYLNIRKEPKSDGAIVGKLEAGGACEVLSVSSGWYKIHSGDVTGYVFGKYLAVGQTARTLAVRNMKLMARVDVDALRVRMAPGMDAEILDVIRKGGVYEVLHQRPDGWVKIRYKESDGYIYALENTTLAYTVPEAVKVSPKPELRQKVVNYAVQFVGNRYQWGGTNPNTGADCSGFVQYVMGHAAGIHLNRTSRDQAREGRPISSGEMQPGDLIFYAGGGVINHVAMYIGDGKIVHAASTRSGIKISNWNYRQPAAIRRVINN